MNYAVEAATWPRYLLVASQVLRHERIEAEQTTYAGDAESHCVRGLGKMPINFAKFDRKALSLVAGPW